MSNELNRGQTVVPFGVGAIYDYLNFTAISLSTDDWEFGENSNTFLKLKVKNPRLLFFINKKLKDLQGDDFEWIPNLLNPPIKKERGMPRELYDIFYSMPVRKFPEYHVCTRCGHLSKPHPLDKQKARCENPSKPNWLSSSCSSLPTQKKPFLEPSRFIAFCEDGHIQDVPWREIMKPFCADGCNEMDKPNPELYLTDDGNGLGFASLNLTCGNCGSRKNLTGLNKKDGLKDKDGVKILSCQGKKPWLLNSTDDQCGKDLRIEPRGASTIYSPIQETGLFIPDPNLISHPIENEFFFEQACQFFDDNKEALLDDLIKTVLFPLSEKMEPSLNEKQIKEKVKKYSNQKNDINNQPIDIDSEQDDFFYKEFCVLKSDLKDEEYESFTKDFSTFSEFTQKYLTSVHSINKLKAATALLGFQRGQGKFNCASKDSNFIPAFEVSGEGIFLNIGYEKVKNWLDKNPDFDKRKKILSDRAKKDFRDHPSLYSETGFVMLHSLSHALLRQISLECGYGINELKERVYFSHKNKMAGILIYTSSSDSSGSLGGLVRMSRPEYFDGMFENAIDNCMNCSNDPICTESIGQGLAGLSFAGCHSCLMVPDLACDVIPKNTYLDRTTLIGLGLNLKGYFS